MYPNRLRQINTKESFACPPDKKGGGRKMAKPLPECGYLEAEINSLRMRISNSSDFESFQKELRIVHQPLQRLKLVFD